jgi:hypothetical protein
MATLPATNVEHALTGTDPILGQKPINHLPSNRKMRLARQFRIHIAL